nr:hypothetical protein [Tanacetum cinerariifolium]
MYDVYKFQKTFQMARPLFNRIVDEVTSHSSLFHDNINCTEREGNSPLLKRAPEISFVADGVTYPWEYYLVDKIYPKLVTLFKTIQESADDDYKRIKYKQKQESTKKDVKRGFGVLKKKCDILANPERAMKEEKNKEYDVYIHHIT